MFLSVCFGFSRSVICLFVVCLSFCVYMSRSEYVNVDVGVLCFVCGGRKNTYYSFHRSTLVVTVCVDVFLSHLCVILLTLFCLSCTLVETALLWRL